MATTSSQAQPYHQPSTIEEVRTLWIGDLQYWVDENYLSHCFAHTGEVVSIKIIRNKMTGQPEGYGFVEFVSHGAAERVLQSYNGTQMPGTEQTFRLNWASFGIGERRPDAGPEHSIFVGDLAPDVTDYLLQETFRAHYPSVRGAKVVTDPNTGRSKGYGFVKFSDENERNRAMTEMNGVYCSTRPMRISAATPKKTTVFQHQYAAAPAPAPAAPKAIYPIPAYTTPVNTVAPDYDANNTTIFVGNLDLNVSEEELKQTFLQFGEIVSVKIQAGKGCGFVQFGTRASAEEAIQKMQGKMMGQQVIRVSWGRTLTARQSLKKRNGKGAVEVSFAPVSPDKKETKKRNREGERTIVTRALTVKKGKSEKKKKSSRSLKSRVYFKRVVYDEGEFEVGDDVYVKRREDSTSDDEYPEVEECRLCFCSSNEVMIECDACLGGFHLKCLTPPLKDVPEGDWICGFCEARKMGKEVNFPKPPEGKKLVRTMRQKLLSSDLWAAHIESIWKEVDGNYWCRVRWYTIPEETAAGRQPHNLSRELYRTNDFADIEMESVLRHCYVMIPKEYAKAGNEGDDVFLCEYEYDIHWHSFKRLADIDDERENGEETDGDEDWNLYKEPDSDPDEEDGEYEEENFKNVQSQPSTGHQLAANLHKGRFFGLQKIGTKKIPQHVRSHKQTDLERAKATLLLASLPKSLPCRNKEMEEITSFIKGAICDNQCLGRCLYIHGVPGTGKTMSVLAVMRSLRSEVDAGNIKPYCFVEINGLKLATPENIYRVIYEALNGHGVSWKKALHLLNERFVEGKKTGEEADRPCILLIDELDLLVTRNQSVLYNILDWPTKPHSKLIVIGIANTMDLPEKLLPRISSRMGIQRLCFGPYNYQQLQEIISSRLKGIDVFEKQAIEFASRKVAAISGDARRALEICRRAAEIADYRMKKLISNPDFVTAGKGLVGMADVEAAIQEMFQAPHIQVMKRCSRLSKIFLTAMVHELYKTGMGETTFEKLAMAVSCLCTSNGEVFPGYDTLLQVGCKLGECRVILCEAGSKHRLQKLQLNFPSDDVSFALRDGKDVPWLSKYLM